jgi:pimeloyl-ACP methyl ester carboxylesterase
VSPLQDDDVQLPGGPRLAVRRAPGPRRPFLLVHGLSSNARLWDGVAARLVESGHEVLAVDQRGHGRSEQAADGYTTDRCAADLAELAAAVGLVGDREPVAVGQSWGGNVVLTLAARHGGVAGVGLVDGGWIALGERFATFEECWAALAPPRLDGMRLDDFRQRLRAWHPDWPEAGIEGTLGNFAVRADGTAVPRLARDHHQQILRSLWEGDPRPLYPKVRVPVLLAPAVPADADDHERSGPLAALERLPDASVSWYEGADHDLHAQQPDRLAADLLALVDRVEAARR